MARSRILGNLLLLLCICALRISGKPRINIRRVTGSCVRREHPVCSYYQTQGHCTSASHRRWMKTNCARRCGYCSTTTGIRTSQFFQIQSSGYNKCITVLQRVTYNWRTRRNRKILSLQLTYCNRQSTAQSWSWTSDGRLKSALNQQCLSVVGVWRGGLGKRYGVSLQPCNSRTVDQEWTCDGPYLKVKNKKLYLVPALYSGRRGGTVTVDYTVTSSCMFRRYGSSKSLCKLNETVSENPWIQIKNSNASNKCLALRVKSKLRVLYRGFPLTMTLDTCDRNSARQLWQWTEHNQLKLKHNGYCLTYSWLRSNIYFQQCSASNRYQRWSCVGDKLKINGKYLTAFMYSGLPLGYNVNARRHCGRKMCSWSRLGSGLTVCDNGKAVTTTAPITTKMISTQGTTSTPSTTNPAVTTTNRPTTTQLTTTAPPPPVPTTGDIATPPVPPTGDIATPPLPPTGDVATPPLPPTGDIGTPPVPTDTLIPPPIPANTPPVPPFPPMTVSVVTTPRPSPPVGNRNIRCGTKGRAGGVVNGTRAAAGSHPWQVGIKKCAHCNITCGGTLINDEWVVTAAHCVTGYFPNELYIVIGEVDQSVKSGNEQRFKGSKILVHQDYEIDAPYDKDIALIKLDKYAVFNDHVRPLCMPKTGTVLTETDFCKVTGFGRVTQNGKKSAVLLEANVKIVPLNTCVKSYASLLRPRKVTTNMLCAGYKKGGTDACQGDSGGPLTCFDRKNSRFILGGLVSWGIGCARPNLYGVYTNTALFTTWVQEKVAEHGY